MSLRGILNMPKETTPRRNFLQENKKQLRKLEEDTTKKLETRSLLSQTGLMKPRTKTNTTTTLPPKSKTERSIGSARSGTNVKLPNDAKKQPVIRPDDKKCHEAQEKKCSTCGSKLPYSTDSLEYRDCSMQTDDITDENYLRNALLRCDDSGSSIDCELDTQSCRRSNISGKSMNIDLDDELSYCDMHDEVEKYDKVVGSDIELEEEDFDQNSSRGDRSRQREMSRMTILSSEDDEQPRNVCAKSISSSNRSLGTKCSIQNSRCSVMVDDDELVPLDSVNTAMRDGLAKSSGGIYDTKRSGLLRNVSHTTIMEDGISLDKKRSSKKINEQMQQSRSNLKSKANLTKSKRRDVNKMGSHADQQSAVVDLKCPPGHKLLSECDRLAELTDAKKNYDILMNELSQMPIAVQTLRIRNRRNEIEKELGEIEKKMGLYSKEKVYIKL